MAHSSKSTDIAKIMLRNLVAAEDLAASLAATAPSTMAREGGAQALVATRGHPTGAWFWSIAPMADKLWERMAAEHQAKYRAYIGDV
jgi:hypothetical protein